MRVVAVPKKVTYTFDEWFKYIKEAEGDIAIFSAQPTSVRWIGNERESQVTLYGIKLKEPTSQTM